MGLSPLGRKVQHLYKALQKRSYRLPLFQCRVVAGFPSPGDSEIEGQLDLNELLIKHPAATFYLKVSGSSMINAGIHDGDILIVDRSLEPKHGKIVIAALNGELTVKRLHIDKGRVFLVAENRAFAPIEITEAIDLHIWGIVTSVIHTV